MEVKFQYSKLDCLWAIFYGYCVTLHPENINLSFLQFLSYVVN